MTVCTELDPGSINKRCTTAETKGRDGGNSIPSMKRQLVRDRALTKNHETILCGGVYDWSIRWRDSECPEWHKQQPGHIVISH